MAKLEEISLSNLLVNTENYRFEPISGQKEAIDQMIDDQGEKLFHLAEHILQNGLNPNDKVQVVASSSDSTKYIVLEGNRRTVALKLASNPSLIDNPFYDSLAKKFKKLHDSNSTKLIKKIECTVYDDPTEANKWIKLKHAGQSNGVGTVDWNAQQIQRFDEKVGGKSSTSLQTIKLLQNSVNVPNDIKTNLSKLPITSLDRLLSDPDVRSFLGIEVNNGVLQSSTDEAEVVKGLSQIAKNLLDPSFNVKRIYTKDDRRSYLASFPASNLPNTKV